ncbi:MAG: hypothetical protein IKK34_08285 [Clostridia bacterium]|nr:hypothetical protein [Clostridia bacterium]
MKRYEAMRALSSIEDMSDHEISINAEFIRKTASAAISHLGSMSRVLEENRKLRTTVQCQKQRIRHLESTKDRSERHAEADVGAAQDGGR